MGAGQCGSVQPHVSPQVRSTQVASSCPSSSDGALEVQVAATELMCVAGVPAYHTSVILGGREYYFDSNGIVCMPAFFSHLTARARRPGTLRMEVHRMGESASSGAALIQHLVPFFASGTYDVLYKNCNTFTDAALYFLTRNRLDERFCKLERWLVSTRPFSIGLLNAALWAAAATAELAASSASSSSAPPPGEKLDASKEGTSGADGATSGGPKKFPKGYCANPLAETFCMQDVIASCDRLDRNPDDDVQAAGRRMSSATDGPGGNIGGSCDLFGLPICSCSFVLESADTSAAEPSAPGTSEGDAGAAAKRHLLPGLPCGPDDQCCPLSGPTSSELASPRLTDEVLFTTRELPPLPKRTPPPPVKVDNVPLPETGGAEAGKQEDGAGGSIQVLGRSLRSLEPILSL